MRGPKSLTGRVTLAATAAVAGALIVAGIAVVIATGQSDRRDVDEHRAGLQHPLDRERVGVHAPRVDVRGQRRGIHVSCSCPSCRRAGRQ